MDDFFAGASRHAFLHTTQRQPSAERACFLRIRPIASGKSIPHADARRAGNGRRSGIERSRMPPAGNPFPADNSCSGFVSANPETL